MTDFDTSYIDIDVAPESRGRPHAFVLVGEVVEVFEREGMRFARVVANVPAVLNVPAGPGAPASDAQLGDQIVVEGTLAIHGVRVPSVADEWAEGT